MTTLIRITDPFRPTYRPMVQQLPHLRGALLADALREQGLLSGDQPQGSFIVAVNGEWQLRAQWHQLHLTETDTVLVHPVVHGGGGSNPLRMVLQLAVLWAAVTIPGAQWGLGLAKGSFAFAAAGMGITLAGNALLNAVMPVKVANASTASQVAAQRYGISGNSNTAELLQPIPVVYGRRRIYPPYAARPYSENYGNSQYLYGLYVITQGLIDIEAIRIGDTPIGNFAEVQYEVIQPGGAVTLFPDNVTVSEDVGGGLELLAVGADERPEDGWYGSFVINAAGTTINYVGIDLALPRGLVNVQDNGGHAAASVSYEIQVRRIDDSGAPVGGWVVIQAKTLTMATIDPQLLSERHAVPAGRYEGRARRTNAAGGDRVADTLTWTGMRGYMPSTVMYGDITMLAVVIRATNNINSSNFAKINVTGTRRLPVFDGNAWSAPVATRNPAWAWADALRNSRYGRGWADKRINLPELHRLAGVWNSRGDTFDHVFDRTQSLWDALSLIARVGRAVPISYAGVVDVVRNEAKTVKRGSFTPAQIVAGSLDVEYIMVTRETPNYVIVEYTDPTTWEPAEVECVLQGVAPTVPARLKLEGVTSRNQAWREGMSLAAANRDQRRLVTFTLEKDGELLRYGNLISIAHDMPAWGQFGDVVAYDAQTGRLVLDRPLEWTSGVNHYIAPRKRDGAPAGPYRVIPGPTEDSCALAGVPLEVRRAIYISDGINEEPTSFQFGPANKMGLDAIVLTAVPDDESLKWTVLATNYAESVHTAEINGNPPPPPPPSRLPSIPTTPIVSGLSVVRAAVPGAWLITCIAAAGAARYEYQASNDAGASWQALPGSGQSTAVQLAFGAWQIRARAIGTLPGPWALWAGELTIWEQVPSAPQLSLRAPWSGQTIRINVLSGVDRVYSQVEIYVGSVSESHRRATFTTTSQSIDYSYDDAQADDAVAGTLVFVVRDGNGAGLGPAGQLIVSHTAPAAPVVTVTVEAGSDESSSWYDYKLQVAAINASDFKDIEIRDNSGALLQTGPAGKTYTVRRATITATFRVVAVNVWGGTATTVVTGTWTPPGGDGGGG